MGSLSLCLNIAVVRKPRWIAGMAEGLKARDDRTMRADMMEMMIVFWFLVVEFVLFCFVYVAQSLSRKSL
jgi:hypothetical protein